MRILFLLLFFGIYDCNAQVNTAKKQPVATTQSKPDFTVALNFINGYVKYIMAEEKNKPSRSSWVKNNVLLTPAFKASYKALEDANDPEFGFEADPILDAQDLPEKGFVIVKTDASQGYVTVRGVGTGWEKFTVVLKVTKSQNKWLVDGSGIVNIPASKQAKR